MSERSTYFSSRIEVITDQGSSNDPDIVQGIAGFPKNGAPATERSAQGREREQWMASVVHVNPATAEATPRNELSDADRHLMAVLQREWRKLIGKYRVPVEHALEEMKAALLGGAATMDILAGYPATGAPLLDSKKAGEMLEAFKQSILKNGELSARLSCGEARFEKRYHRLSVTIVHSSV